MVKVNNVPAWAWEKPYMVINWCNDQAWFYDAWDDLEKAIRQAEEENAVCVDTARCEGA